MSEKKKDSEPEPLADGVEHISGNLYRVRLSAVNLAERPEEESSEEFEWYNIRYMTTGEDGVLGRGFDRPNQARLRDSIRDEGLYYPLIGRWISKGGERTIQLVDGERRFRNIDFLVKKNEKCKNPVTGEFEPAKTLYESVEMRVFDAPTDKECLKLAYKSGTCRVDFGDEADYNLVYKLMFVLKWPDEEILDTTGQRPEWLRDFATLIETLGDDERTRMAFLQGAISRAAALELGKIKEVGIRHTALDVCLEYAEGEAKRKIHKIEREVIKAKEHAEVAKAKAAEANFTKDHEGEREANEELETATKRVSEKQKEKEEVKPVANARHARQAKDQMGKGEDRNKPTTLRANQIRTAYQKPLEAAIQNEGKDPEDKFLGHPDYLRALLAVVNAILDGEQEPIKIFRKFGKRLGPSQE